jgi:hypothetical protein
MLSARYGASQPKGCLCLLLVPVDLPQQFAPRPIKERDKESANIVNGKANCH